ncbi:hypothetical protein [Tahibacter soli]|uniref:Ig-like domain-containing protein n=1 Tax=Tahibacter soli TaxID=2983605 RepID=A0A9X3YH30_9GAMM|nr:hypothetical protein [Tahibacter soli]MDC8012126.1 hypothetical protein [Tahibacter soli]
MRTLHPLSIAFALAAVGWTAGNSAVAAELCELVKCANGCYTSRLKAADLPASGSGQVLVTEGCPISEDTTNDYIGFKIPLASAPGPVSLDCANVDGHHYCEAWPQGDSITYSWSSGGSFVPDSGSGSANPVRGFSCTPGTQGTITVIAYSPSGASKSQTESVTCPTTP